MMEEEFLIYILNNNILYIYINIDYKYFIYYNDAYTYLSISYLNMFIIIYKNKKKKNRIKRLNLVSKEYK